VEGKGKGRGWPLKKCARSASEPTIIHCVAKNNPGEGCC